MKMNQAPRLELRQGQSLVMTYQLQQSIKLLQCNALELREFVDQELEKNPFLLQEDSSRSEQEDDAPKERSTLDDKPREADFSGDENFSSEAQSNDYDESGDIERDYLQPSHSSSTGGGDYGDSDDSLGIESNAAEGKSLREHLLEQLQLDIKDPVERIIGSHLVDLVDDAGYIKEDMKAQAEMLGAPVEDVLNVLEKLQAFEPAGICARDLKECLALQLREKNRLDPIMQILLDNLNLIAEAKFDVLQKKCGVDREDIRDMIIEIRELNPKPGSGFSHELSQVVEPDLFIRRTPDNNWHLELNMNNFPKVMVNKRYYKKVTSETRNVKDKEYLSERFGSANWLVRALEQRADTMLKVGGELIKQQDAFFRLGVKYLRPMTLKDIAAATGYHESTISRVTNGKFLICPRGTFELKYFFTSALTRTHGGGDVSSLAVKQHIDELIKSEHPEHILSDDDLVELLAEKNITVARRTVAKYREALHIPSSPKRKRVKLAVF